MKKEMTAEAKAKIAEGVRKAFEAKRAAKLEKEVIHKAFEEVDNSKIKEDGDTVTLNGYFKLEIGTYKVLRHNIETGINTMLIGATGTGKTEVISNLAKALDLPLTIFDMGTMTDPVMGLVGSHVISVEGGVTKSEFKRSRFSEVIQQPGIILLDEISRAGAMANNLLFPCLDFRRELPMEYSFHDTTPVKVHPKCVLFSTANMGSQYTGTHKLDRALLDRFMLVEMDAIKKEDIISTLGAEFPGIEKVKINKMVDTFVKINKEHDDFKISFNLSLRHLKTIAKLVQNGFEIYDGFFTLCKGLGGKEGLTGIKSILDSTKTS